MRIRDFLVFAVSVGLNEEFTGLTPNPGIHSHIVYFIPHKATGRSCLQELSIAEAIRFQ